MTPVQSGFTWRCATPRAGSRKQISRFLAAVVLAATVPLLGCFNDILHPPATGSSTLLVGYAASIAASAAQEADGIHVRVTEGTSILHDSIHAVPAGQSEVRLRISLELEAERATLDVLVEVLDGLRTVSRGARTVELTRGGTTEVMIGAIAVEGMLTAGDGHTCRLSSSGTAYCWGSNGFGQLGIGSTITPSRPVQVATAQRFTTIAAGTYHTCALNFDGEAFCWGRNDFGQTGDGSTTGILTPTPVAGDRRFAQITGGVEHTCGLTTDAELYCWGGRGVYSVLGDPGTRTSLVPRRVPGPAFSTIDAGFWHTCGLSDGDVYCWGFAFAGPAYSDAPAPFSTPEPIVSIASGVTNSCGLTAAGVALCWGGQFLTWGVLGNGSPNGSASPVMVGGPAGWRSIGTSVGNSIYAPSCAIAADERIHCWGSNVGHVLGTQTTTECQGSAETRIPCSLVPTPVDGGLRFLAVAPGGRHACGLSTNDDVYCWGSGALAALGTGDLADRPSPTRVGAPIAPPNVTTIDLSLDRTVAAVGDTVIGRADLRDQSGFPALSIVTWQSSDSSVAAVIAPGRIHARGSGVTTITATAQGISASAQLTVQGPGVTTSILSVLRSDGTPADINDIRGEIDITAGIQAGPGSGLARLELLVDGEVVSSAAPSGTTHTFRLNTAERDASGAFRWPCCGHRINVRAVDAAGRLLAISADMFLFFRNDV